MTTPELQSRSRRKQDRLLCRPFVPALAERVRIDADRGKREGAATEQRQASASDKIRTRTQSSQHQRHRTPPIGASTLGKSRFWRWLVPKSLLVGQGRVSGRQNEVRCPNLRTASVLIPGGLSPGTPGFPSRRATGCSAESGTTNHKHQAQRAHGMKHAMLLRLAQQAGYDSVAAFVTAHEGMLPRARRAFLARVQLLAPSGDECATTPSAEKGNDLQCRL